MRLGQEVLLRDHIGELRGKKVGLLANPSSVDHTYRHILSALRDHLGNEIVTLFGPEHGFDASAQDMIPVDEESEGTTEGPKVISLYGDTEESLKPQRSDLAELDILLVDIQDVGARYYTYQATMAFALERAQGLDLEVIVLDRPNPIGRDVEGSGVEAHLQNFCAVHPIPQRHGMTLGELALMYQKRFYPEARLRVIAMDDYAPESYGEEFPWVLPSPNMPTVDTAVVYPGMCLLEGTLVSEGRGTTRPFELFGAPYIDPNRLCEGLNTLDLPGCTFRPTSFLPTFQKWGGELCHGAQLHVTDRGSFRAYRAGIAVLWVLRQRFPEDFKWRTERYEFRDDVPAIDLLTGYSRVREDIDAGKTLDEVLQVALQPAPGFDESRRASLLYE